MIRTILLAGGAVAGVVAPAVAGPTLYSSLATSPTGDRWNYAFNPEPGDRDRASVFGATGEPDFDDRDGQFYVTFNTADDIPAGLGAAQYEIVSATLTLMTESDAAVAYDITPDSYTAFLPVDDPDYVPDADPGQPIELYGAGFRFGFTPVAWGESGPYSLGSPIGEGIRVCYPTDYAGELSTDLSNHVRDRWDPAPWAIGTVDGLTPGQIIPQDSHVTFDLDVSRPDVQAYLADALDAGLLPLTVTSLHLVVQQGGEFPTFYTKENVLVEFELADAAMLSLDVLVYDEPFTNPPDFDGDGTVGPADLAVLLAAWGRCDGCPEDLDGDGVVGPADLAILLAKWG